MQNGLLTVSQLNEYLRMKMDSDLLLSDVLVRGEISNFTNHYKTGHFYFSLKDETGLLRAVMFRSYASRLAFLPENGMKVILHGRVTVFPRDGQYQLYADDMQPDGVGALWIAYEQLRKKLEAEGLFSPYRKRPLPKYPERIGIVTSPTGAAVRDMMRILKRRFPIAEVLLYPALVQGPGAAAEVKAGIEFFNRHCPVDVLIVGRGGGSAEDLFAFNDENLVRAVAASSIPVVSAVGHDTDTTLCDFAADLAVPTPSAAAEQTVPEALTEKKKLMQAAQRLSDAVTVLIKENRRALEVLSAAKVLQSPRNYLDNKRMQLSYLAEHLGAASEKNIALKKQKFSSLTAKLSVLNPLGVLSRGYAAVFDEEGKNISCVKSLEKGKILQVKFADGTAQTVVKSIREGEENG